MAVEVARTVFGVPWSGGAARRLLALPRAFVPMFAAIAGGAVIFALARPGAAVGAAIVVTCGLLAGAAGAFAADRRNVAVARRVAVLSQALDAAPQAQLLLAAHGDAPDFANLAFDRLFPPAGGPALVRIERALVGDAAAHTEFRRLCERAAKGMPARATLEFGRASGDASYSFEACVDPVADGRGSTWWRFAPAAALRPCPDPFRPLFNDAPLGIALIDGAGRLTAINRTGAALFGRAPQALVGCALVELLRAEERGAVAELLGAARAGRTAHAPVEIRLDRPRERTLDLLVNPLGQSADGSLAVHFVDVTERKLLESQFAHSQKMQAIGQLAGGMAHDFNNLLTAMIGFCDLLLLRSRPGDPAFSDIMQIKQNANRAGNLVRQLLAFSRQQPLQPRILDVTDALVELSHMLRRLIGESVVLEVIHARDLGLVKVDQGQFEQVVINLAINARDAMPQGGRLTIRTTNLVQSEPMRRGHETMPAGEYVAIEVADTGIGIAPDHLPHIFEPFFSTKEAGSGTGLGLSTVYGIVRQTGGFVFVDSVVGEGSRFRICLPRYAGDMAAAARPDAAEPAPRRDLTGCGTLLLVEDDGPVRTFSARALRNKGYHVIEAKSGAAALEAIAGREGKIDLVVTDVAMPELDGPALVQALRRSDPAIKVVFTSGYAEDAFRQRLDRDGDIRFLAKPFSLKELALTVKEAIGAAPE